MLMECGRRDLESVDCMSFLCAFVEQEGVTGDGFVVFFWLLFFLPSLVEILGCQDVEDVNVEDFKVLQRSDVFIGQGSRGFAILLCNLCFKSLKDLLGVFDIHSFGIHRFFRKQSLI